MPKVSVVITCYNYGRFLAEAVESVLAQTYRDYEIIIVDDGSTDETKAVAASLVEKYFGHAIKFISQANRGVSAARNNGISASSGEYIAPLDADDKLCPAFLEETVRTLDSDPGLGFAYTQLRSFGVISEMERIYPFGYEYDFGRLLKENIIPNTSLFRKSAWAAVGGYKDMHYEDWEFWIALGEAGYPGRLVKETLCMYRRHGVSRSEDYVKKFHSYYRILMLKHPGLYAPVSSRFAPALVPYAIYFKACVRDPVSHYLFRNLPGLHAFLRKRLKGENG